MTYSQALEKIHSLNKFGSRPGLDRIKMLLKLMGNPQDKTRFIHVAGTNGKGSTCALVSSVLKSANYKTGLFISPFITDFCERIQINNTPIPHDTLCELTEYVFSFVDKLNAENIIITEFEFVTAVCFEYFKREKVDLAVLETGMGGLLDSTNTINDNICSVITHISLDHTDILGNTLEEIAAQKCGIIKRGRAVISSSQENDAKKVIEETAKKLGCTLNFGDEISLDVISQSILGTEVDFEGTALHLPLCGSYQLQNLGTALKTIEVLKKEGFDISNEALAHGIKTASNPARFEVLSSSPLVVLDGAHNADGMSAFAKSINELSKNSKRILITGMLRDKDSESSASYIEGLFDTAFAVPVSNPRARTSDEMADILKKHFSDVRVFDNAFDAFDKAFALAKATGAELYICGSLYLAGELRPYIIKSVEK